MKTIPILLLIALGCGFLRPAFSNAGEPDHAFLMVNSRPTGLQVLLDGKHIGITPITSLAIKPGSHVLILRRSRFFSWRLPDWQTEFKADAGDTVRIFKAFNYTYLIQSMPFGAAVYRGAELLGETPLMVELEDTVAVELTVTKEGYQPARVLCIPGGKQYFNILLEPQEDYFAAREKLEKSLVQKRERYRRIAIISGGVSLAAGLAAILLKKKADRLFGQYQQTAYPPEMNRLFSQTKKYDRYSGVAFGLFQLGFGISFYSFLKSNQP